MTATVAKPIVGPLRHEYRASNGYDGVCEVRIYAATEASAGLPIVLLTDVEGPSVTNTVEQLAAEILLRHLGQQDGLDPPCVVIEHYRDRQPRYRRYHDPLFGESFDRVTFASWTPKHHRFRPVRHLGTPDWRRTDRAEVERLVGGTLDWPACTCELR